MQHQRTELLVGAEGIRRLRESTVVIVGLGGVGAYALEAVARAGVGHIRLVDADVLEASNLNRQLLALHSTLGKEKVAVAARRIADIDPDIRVESHHAFADSENIAELIQGAPFVLDAIDSVASKIELLFQAKSREHTVVSCMGAARKLDPTGLRVEDISKTSHCPLARVIRQGLRRRGLARGIPCVYTWEKQAAQDSLGANEANETPAQGRAQGSISYVPGLIGLTAAGLLIQSILGNTGDDNS